MDLIKKNIEKKREVYKLDDRYRKVWYDVDMDRLDEHVSILEDIIPGYVLDYGKTENSMYIDYHIVPGTPANTFAHTPQFIRRIHDFCHETLEQTLPYAHYDWVLSNIMIDGENTYLVDWDNVGIYSPEEIYKKIESKIKVIAVGDNFNDLDMLRNCDIPCLVFNDQFKQDQINIDNLIVSNKPSPEGWADVIKTALVKLDY